MVLPDQYDSIEVKQSSTNGFKSSGLYCPSTVQRVIAFAVDLLIFAPVIGFILVGLFSQLKLTSLVTLGSPEVNEIYFLYGMAYFLIWIFFQTGFSYFYQATPGQYFLKMEIRKLDLSEPQLIHIFFRHLFFPLHIFTFGLSLLEKFFNTNSLCFHDKISETQLLTTVEQDKEELKDFEKKFLISWFQSGLVLLLVVCGLFVYVKFRSITELKYSRAYFYQKNPECQAYLLNQYSEDQKRLAANTADDLKKSFSSWAHKLNFTDHFYFFLTQHRSASCIKREADLVLYAPAATEKMKALAYVAKAFSSESTAHDESYLSKACELDSNLCYLKQGENVSPLNYPSPSNDAERYLLFSFLKTSGHYEQALNIASQVERKNDFLYKERFQTFELWRRASEIKSNTQQIFQAEQSANKTRSPASLAVSAESRKMEKSNRSHAHLRNENSNSKSFNKLYAEFLFEDEL